MGWFTPGSGGGGGGAPTGPAGGDLGGTYPDPTVTGLDGNAVVQYAQTIYVDLNGDASSPGTNPATPTTLSNAIATAGFTYNIIIAEGVYTTGAAITIPDDNITFTARQGGTQSNSVIIQDQIILGPGRTRFRAYGIRFDGGFDDDSAGRHYFSACSAGGGTYDRANPANFMVWKNCDFAALSYVTSGTGTGSSHTIEGAATVLRTPTLGATGASYEIHEARSGQVTLTAGTLSCSDARFFDATLGIDAALGTTVNLFNCRSLDLAGTSATAIDALGNYCFNDVIFDESASSLGTPVGPAPTAFTEGIRYAPAVPGDYSPAVSQIAEALDQLAARSPDSLFYVFGRGGNTANGASIYASGSIGGIGYVVPAGGGTLVEWAIAFDSAGTLGGLFIDVETPAGGGVVTTAVQVAAVDYVAPARYATATASIAVTAGQAIRVRSNINANASDIVAWLRFEP